MYFCEKREAMKFDVEKLKAMARPRSEKELEMVRFREENKDWLAVSERIALIIRHIHTFLLRQLGILPSFLDCSPLLNASNTA